MKVNDCICINSGLDVYQTVYTTTVAVVLADDAAAAAQVSRGIGQVTHLDSKGVCIKWLKGDVWGWWYKRKEIEQNFHVVQNNSIIRTLYGS